MLQPNGIRKYRSSSTTVVAMQWLDGPGDGVNAIVDWPETPRSPKTEQASLFLTLDTEAAVSVLGDTERARLIDSGYTAVVWDIVHNRWINVSTGDWIVRGPQGNLYPMTNAAFTGMFTEVGE